MFVMIKIELQDELLFVEISDSSVESAAFTHTGAEGGLPIQRTRLD